MGKVPAVDLPDDPTRRLQGAEGVCDGLFAGSYGGAVSDGEEEFLGAATQIDVRGSPGVEIGAAAEGLARGVACRGLPRQPRPLVPLPGTPHAGSRAVSALTLGSLGTGRDEVLRSSLPYVLPYTNHRHLGWARHNFATDLDVIEIARRSRVEVLRASFQLPDRTPYLAGGVAEDTRHSAVGVHEHEELAVDVEAAGPFDRKLLGCLDDIDR